MVANWAFGPLISRLPERKKERPDSPGVEFDATSEATFSCS